MNPADRDRATQVADQVLVAQDDDFADRLANRDLDPATFGADERAVAEFVAGVRGLAEPVAAGSVGQRAAALAAIARETGGAGEAGEGTGSAPASVHPTGTAPSPRRYIRRRIAWSLAAALVVLAGTAGLAVAGELPAPLQDAVSGIAARIGLHVPDSAEAARLRADEVDATAAPATDEGTGTGASLESTGVAAQAAARNEMTREEAEALATDNGNEKSQGIGLALGVIKNAGKENNGDSASSGTDPTVPGKSEDSNGNNTTKTTGSDKVKVVNPKANENAAKDK